MIFFMVEMEAIFTYFIKATVKILSMIRQVTIK